MERVRRRIEPAVEHDRPLVEPPLERGPVGVVGHAGRGYRDRRCSRLAIRIVLPSAVVLLSELSGLRCPGSSRGSSARSGGRAERTAGRS